MQTAAPPKHAELLYTLLKAAGNSKSNQQKCKES